MPKCVVLLSGGLDSATCLAIADSLGFELHALTVSYGQRHQAELAAAERVARRAGVKEHRYVSVNLDAIGGSALTADIEVPKNRDEAAMSGSIPVTYVPARNTVLLALALGYAEVIGAEDIFVGVNAVDYSGYPDCRPEFIQAFEHLAAVATRAGVEGHGPTIHAPLIGLNKPEIIRRGLELGVDYSITHSCYDPKPDGRPCEACDSCLIRIRAFEALGMRDPALP
ncbi:MAG TPA: 7-cyano-7-deazaguanine synthase QueC [Fimbriimonadaceae bacterium]|nr:7-cyano-7-deazaguanine synthase QueC [Fimbriimonadaceae bacterium]